MSPVHGDLSMPSHAVCCDILRRTRQGRCCQGSKRRGDQEMRPHVEVPVGGHLDAKRDLLALVRHNSLVHAEVLDGGGEGLGWYAGRLGRGVPGGDHDRRPQASECGCQQRGPPRNGAPASLRSPARPQDMACRQSVQPLNFALENLILPSSNHSY